MRYDTYSLKKLLGALTENFKGVSEIYLFGSRLHRTRSTRSDVDLLIDVDESVVGEDVHDFALKECPALDFFLIDHGVATSCANGSKVRAKNKKDLVNRLGAKKIWNRNSGFLPADIDWDFDVIKGMNPMMTTLVSFEPFPSKAVAISEDKPMETDARGRSSWSTIKEHPMWIIVTVACAVAVAVFSATYQLRIEPLEREISILKEEIAKLSKTVVNDQHGKAKAQTTIRQNPPDASSADAKSHASD